MLDLVQRQRAYKILRNLANQRGCAICVVSHNVAELAGVANRVLVLTKRPTEIATEVVFDDKASPIQRSDCLWKAAENIFDTSALAPLS